MDIEMRPWTIEDNEVIVGWVKEDPSILTSLMMPGDLNEFQVRSYLLAAIDDPNQLRAVGMVDGEVVAAIAAFDIVPKHGLATVSIVTSPDHRDGFTAMKVSRAGIATAFNGVGFGKLRAIVSEENEQALKLARLLGFDDLGVRVLQLTKGQADG